MVLIRFESERTSSGQNIDYRHSPSLEIFSSNFSSKKERPFNDWHSCDSQSESLGINQLTLKETCEFKELELKAQTWSPNLKLKAILVANEGRSD